MSLTRIKEPSVIAKLKAQASMSADAEQILNYIRAIEKANTRLQDDVKGARKEGYRAGIVDAIGVCQTAERETFGSHKLTMAGIIIILAGMRDRQAAELRPFTLRIKESAARLEHQIVALERFEGKKATAKILREEIAAILSEWQLG